MATVALSPSLCECLKTVFGFQLHGNTTTQGKTEAKETSRSLRVLFPADIFFDSSIRNALQLLAETQQQKTHDAPPALEESSSEESSDDNFDDEDVFDEGHQEERPLGIAAGGPQEWQHQQSPSHRERNNKPQGKKTTRPHPLGKRLLALEALKYAGNGDRLTLTLTGSKGLNQDVSMVVYPLLPKYCMPTLMLGVFDGHAEMGHYISEHCRHHLEQSITNELHAMLSSSTRIPDREAIAQRLTSLVEEADRSIPLDFADAGGSTVSMVLQVDRSVYLVNTGDSQSVICAYIPSTQECVILETTVQHTLESREEHKRILCSGARTEDGYVVYDCARQGEEITYGLGMTRALGDRSAPGVIATPAVSAFSVEELKNRARLNSRNKADLKPHDVSLFGICVSDGVLDVASMDEIAPSLAQAFSMLPPSQDVSEAPRVSHPMLEVNFWIHECAERWKHLAGEYRDDITIAAAKIL